MFDRSTLIITAVAVGLGALLLLAANQTDGPPEGFALANGRIEAERIDVATKFAGRVDEIRVDEGDFVDRGTVLVTLDDEEMVAQLREAEAAGAEAEQTLAHAKALLVQRESELSFARSEYARAQTLLEREVASEEIVEQRLSQMQVAEAAIAAAKAEIGRATASIDAAAARVARLRTNLDDYTLTAPKDGRVQYRLASAGEVLPAGGRVLTLLDLTDVYMTVFLPTSEAGRLSVGAPARIVLDAAPEYVIPASITFVAAEAQFTPKYVETVEERAKLMFRVKVRIPSEVLQQYQQVVKTGLPGIAYLPLSTDTEWPEELAPRLPEPPTNAEPQAPSATNEAPGTSPAESAGQGAVN
ncbi:MAG: HlyD family efflux transporter periplasmic adaptor subunit [Pseudomonadota bacterium]